MPLVDLKSNLANYRSDFTTPSVVSQATTDLNQPSSARSSAKTSDSILDINVTPKKYDANTQFTQKFIIKSKYNLDEVPNTFNIPITYPPSKLLSRPLTNSKFPNNGIATLDDQFPNGSIFRYAKEGTFATKKFSPHGYSEGYRYSDNIKSIKGQSNKSILFKRSTEQNSPSAIDEQYKKFSLINESYNTSYINQPFIIRGIQRKGKETPQFWGFDSKAGFDDGLIRGGATTVADRIAADTERIGKWLSSIKGLMWTNKQADLGLTRPKVETIGDELIGQNNTGVTSLLSVAGTPLGLHFSNKVINYETILREKKQSFNVAPALSNRLIHLKTELGVNNIFGKPTTPAGAPILSLSGLGGASSVYGLGYTAIRRYYNSTSTDVRQLEEIRKVNPFTDTRPYEQSYDKEKFKNLTNKISESKLNTNTGKSTEYPNTPNNDINNYITMAYGKIPKNSTDLNALKRDFRNALSGDTKGFTGKTTDEDYYNKFNLESRYGFGELGKVGSDRTDPKKFLEKGKTFGRNRKILVSNKDFRGDRVNALDVVRSDTDKTTRDGVYSENGQDLIKFYFQDGALTSNKGKRAGVNTMAFRATITGFTDAFSPGWNKIDILGRPDGVYQYETFERNISFNFIAAAYTRSEMIPMWRKLNYLASYTMPDFNNNTRPSGPFMRITLGDLFYQTPGFISSLSYNVSDDATWDIADDYPSNPDAKQLPMSVEVSISFSIVGDYRPQLYGRVYSLSPGGIKDRTVEGQWLPDASF
jgi:hypothetical protein